MKADTKKIIEALEDMRTAFLIRARETAEPKPDGVSYGAFLNADICRKAAEELKRYIPQKMEVEGGGTSWWYVCPECHGAIDSQDLFCRHCGQAVEE